MPSYALNYGFTQRFPFPAKDVYEWCVDYRTDDWARMGKKGKRRIRRVDQSTLILDDTVFTDGKAASKTRLVKMYPQLLMWTNTRISPAGRHSQFIYRIIPESEKSSRLEFTGAQVEESKRRLTLAQVAEMSKHNERDDSALWVLLAEEMRKDLGTHG